MPSQLAAWINFIFLLIENMSLNLETNATVSRIGGAAQSNPPSYKPTSRKTVSFFLFCLDLIGLYGFWLIAQTSLSPGKAWQWYLPIGRMWPYAVLLIIFYIFELYKINGQISGLRSPARTFVAVLSTCVAVVFLNHMNPIYKPIPLTIIALNFAFFSFWASACRYLAAKISQSRLEKVRWLVVDPENIFVKIYPQFVKKHADQNFSVLTSPTEFWRNDDDESSMQNIGTLSDLPEIAGQSWSGIVVTNPKLLTDAQNEILTHNRLGGIPVYNLYQFYEEFLYKIPVTHLEKDWFVVSEGFGLLRNPIGLKLKRTLDFLNSVLLLTVTCPLLTLLAGLIKLTSRGPAIFKQKRTGENGKEFTLYKFRSMVQDAEKNGAQWAARNDPRVTRLGKFMRVTRLDELPQLVNVLKGDMSFIGPRPERPVFNKELEKRIPFYDLRHLVKPGITGWAQVLYPYGASVEDAKEKLEYDLYYIKNYSFLLDISIVFKTVRTILLGKGR